MYKLHYSDKNCEKLRSLFTMLIYIHYPDPEVFYNANRDVIQIPKDTMPIVAKAWPNSYTKFGCWTVKFCQSVCLFTSYIQDDSETVKKESIHKAKSN